MSIELTMLAWAIALGLVQLLLTGALVTRQRGVKWNAGNRDAPVPPASGVAARMERATRNFMETFPFFAAAALAVIATQRGSDDTALGAQMYVWARLVYVPVYAIGIPYLRTAVWAVGFWGMFKVLSALF